MAAPPKIRKLSEDVINRIGAGEVIQNPFNALKEMLENSLDAGSSVINVTVKNGGLTLMLISDNGCGIGKDDLPILCERYTTSKLTKFEDLRNMNTYGFRGEALSSISYVSRLSIVTKTANSQIAYKAAYENGKMLGTAKPCAAVQGTQIRVEDLFYNLEGRKIALSKNSSENYRKILSIVSKYAIHNAHASFLLKKEGEQKTDVKTPPNSNVIDNIKLIYGSAIAKELMEITDKDDLLKFSLSGQISNVNYSHKKFNFLLFINQRLVKSDALKKVIEQVYSTYLPKGNHPFVYLSIVINPSNIDVNVNPTKEQVHFLHEEAIIEKIRKVIENKLVGSNSSRSMYAQAKLPTSFTTTAKPFDEAIAGKKVYDQDKVRSDGSVQKIDKFFKEVNISMEENSEVAEKRNVNLASIIKLRAEVERNAHKDLLGFVKNFTFVGVVSLEQCLLQHETKVYLCSTINLAAELFYQIILFNFGNFGVINLTEPLSIYDMVTTYYNCDDSGWTEEQGPKDELAKGISSLLQENASMLEDYFSIEVKNGCLHSLPLLISDYLPDLSYLPDFLVRLCTGVDWIVEEPCLQGISKEIAQLYSRVGVKKGDDSENIENSQWKKDIENKLLVAVKSTLLPPKSFTTDGTLFEIANLPDLYKVFERC